jgi:hypothetical protein
MADHRVLDATVVAAGPVAFTATISVQNISMIAALLGIFAALLSIGFTVWRAFAIRKEQGGKWWP